MKKNFAVLVCLIALGYQSMNAGVRTLSMHTTHDAIYSQEVWERCEHVQEGFSRYCYETENVVDGFLLSVQRVVEVMREMVGIAQQDAGIHIGFTLENAPCIRSDNGMTIAFEVTPDDGMSLDALAKHDVLYNELARHLGNEEILPYLDNLVMIFETLSGTAWLSAF